MFNEKKGKTASAIYASGLLWNYLIIIASVVPLIVFLRKKYRELIYVVSCLVLAAVYYLVFYGETVFYNQDINLAINFVSLPPILGISICLLTF